MTADRFKPLLDREFLRAELHYEYQDWLAGGVEAALLDRLKHWRDREIKRETQAEASFIQRFFVETWGYREAGTGGERYNLHPKFSIDGAGQTGNRGERIAQRQAEAALEPLGHEGDLAALGLPNFRSKDP